MQYDPIKRGLGSVVNRTPLLRKLFYLLLDLLLLRAWHIRRELRKARKEMSGPGEILDAGSGFGQYSWFMSGLFSGWKIKGLDVKEEQIRDCNEFFARTGRGNNIDFEVADLVTYRDRERYRLILCVDVMEHILEDVEVFRNYYYSLQEGGIVLISTPSDRGGSDVHDEHEDSFIEEHVRDGYNIDEISEKMKSAGFRSVLPKYSYGWPGKISWRFSMKYPITMLSASKLLYIILLPYYLVTFPFCLLLNWLDVRIKHKTGTGLIVRAIK